MKLYNTLLGVILVIFLFNFGMLFYANNFCNCKIIHNFCVRHEIFGVQYSHIYFYIFLGLFFPSYFWTFQILGLLWELFEIYLDHNNAFAIKYFHGCLSKKPSTIKNQSILNYKVYRNNTKYLNPIDKLFNIKNSKIHFWHGSIAEVIANIFGFYIGTLLNKFII